MSYSIVIINAVGDVRILKELNRSAFVRRKINRSSNRSLQNGDRKTTAHFFRRDERGRVTRGIPWSYILEKVEHDAIILTRFSSGINRVADNRFAQWVNRKCSKNSVQQDMKVILTFSKYRYGYDMIKQFELHGKYHSFIVRDSDKRKGKQCNGKLIITLWYLIEHFPCVLLHQTRTSSIFYNRWLEYSKFA